MFRRLSFVFVLLIGVLGVSLQTVYAGSGAIPTFRIDNQLNGSISVTCPGSVGFTWRVGVDTTSNIHVEQTTSGGSFRLDGSRISNGHHDAFAQVRCSGEPNDWTGATESRVGFDWYGGNPTPVPPPPGYAVSISLNVSPTTVSTNVSVGITVQATCSGTNVRAIRVMVNGAKHYELGLPIITTSWSSSQSGSYTISAEAACSGDDAWKTSPNASVTVTVQAGATSSGGTSSTGTAGGEVTTTTGNTETSNATYPQFRLGTNGVDVDPYCRAKFGQAASNDGVNASSWGCGGNVLNHDAACRDIWGDARPYAWLQGGIAGWTCETTQQPGGQVTQPQQPQVPQVTGGLPQVGYTSAPSGEWVKVVTGMLNVRSSPGTNNTVVIAKAPYGRYFNYLSTSNGWYNVSWGSGSGWVAGGSEFSVRGSGADTGDVPPAPVVTNPNTTGGNNNCGVAPATRLVIGQQGRNTLVGGDTRVRNEPRGAEIDVMLPGETFDVLDGPSCRESGTDGNLNWWKIRVHATGITGWAPEGNSERYWLEPWGQPQADISLPTRTLLASCEWDAMTYDFLSDPATMFGTGILPATNIKWLDYISRILDLLGLAVDVAGDIVQPGGTKIVWNVWSYNNLNRMTLEVVRYNGSIVVESQETDVVISDPRVVHCGYVAT